MIAALSRRFPRISVLQSDTAIAIALGLGSFIILAVNYWLPAQKIFDEVYFPRAGEEYLTRQYIYENTHPPITKLLITLSMILFGGMHGLGDTPVGWRFLDVVFGALAVSVLYLLARKMTGSKLIGAYAAGLFAFDGMHFVQSRISTPESFVVVFSLATLYALYRFWTARIETDDGVRPRRSLRLLGALGSAVLAVIIDLLRFPHETLAAKIVGGVCIFAALYAAFRVWAEPRVLRDRSTLWLVLWCVFSGLLVTSKWYGVMAYGVALVIFVWDRRKFRVDLIAAAVVAIVSAIYFASYTPQYVGLRDLPSEAPRAYTFSDVVTMQYNAFEYHDHLRATHPYSSKWWQWPLDLRPILYYANYGKVGNTSTAALIYTLPNPLILWPGLLTVALVGYWGVRERKRAYLLLVLTYLAQWLPWMGSPRIAFAYHFYVDIPLICVCTGIAVQRALEWARAGGVERLRDVRLGAATYFAAVALAFVYFYPILAGVTITTAQWMNRMWLRSWI